MSFNKKNILLLYDRPLEHSFMPKGEEQVSFDIPAEYVADKYKPLAVELFSRFGKVSKGKIPVKNISLPNLDEILELGRQGNFSLFLPKHRQIAGRLIEIFVGMRNPEELMSMALYARDRVNPYLFNYALSVALLHRPDTQDLDVPTFFKSFPDKFVDSRVFSQSRVETNIINQGSRIPIEIPIDYTASNLEEEHRLAYFREDIGINLHHWHWHLVYPFDGPREVVAKNRRGELFYYMHQQILARYNFERLCNDLHRVLPFNSWRDPIPEGYFPKLDSLVASRAYPGRVVNQTIKDLNRSQDQVFYDVNSMDLWKTRVLSAVHAGMAQDENGRNIPLTEFEGIDILGNMLESSILSPNRTFYGDLHNIGHVFISYIHDPDHRHLESFGVMGDSTTAMRDPIFYRWHEYIDTIFQQHKARLTPYTAAGLDYSGVTVQNIQLQSQGGQPNTINTFWQQSDVDLSRGMDFQPRGSVFVRFTHLQHNPFTYVITVNNSGPPRQGTCRIFIAPAQDERGNPWLLREQRRLFVELDRFVVNLKSGQNTIRQESSQSSVTIPFERSFRDVDTNRPEGGDALDQFNFCGCGWPHHMLIPKGTVAGKQSHLFVMISNYADDKVNQDSSGLCSDASSFCGIKDKLYPDRRAMGYPFDRLPRDGAATLAQFLTPNMRVQTVNIRFNDTVTSSGR